MTSASTTEPAGQVARIVRLVAGHPWVGSARARDDGAVEVVPHPDALVAGAEPGALVREHLEQWAEVYEWVYETAEGRHAEDLDLSGWRASDTGEPLPEAHMRDWVGRTVELVSAQRPRRLLELGCGTGLFAHRLGARLEGYVGTDVAEIAVDRLNAAGLERAGFVRAAAHEAAGERVRAVMDTVFGPGTPPDCVLVNSVTQCFPNLAYLTAVLHGALAVVADGGTVVVGDIRHSGLVLDHFTWLEQARDPQADRATIATRAQAAAAADEELSFAPAAVEAALAGQSRPVRLGVHARTMADDTELTRYRYDLVLHVGPHPPAEPPRHVTWTPTPHTGEGRGSDRDRLRELVGEAPVVVREIPNALLVDGPGAVSPFGLREALAGLDAAVLLDAADPHLLAVVAPADRAPEATAVAGPAVGPVAHEPFPLFVRRRLPEVLRDHVRRSEPQGVVPVIVVRDEEDRP